MYINKNKVKHNNGGFMKRILLVLFFLLLIFSYNKESTMEVFSYENDEVYNNYYLTFNDCDLNTNNFIEKLGVLNSYDFKILKIVPYKEVDKEFLYYTNDLDYILNNFKNDYINLMINNDLYTSNICIKNIKINTSNIILSKLSNVIFFTY